ncbi:PREDICTED: WD repeat, SAM and U-box domain-containing protein 1 isoform X2 [Nicrophorus vespilloides]|nr:PREDICTED: WD repeat, SAM and U-box domain-containing protein 1 isoform X2 [Nicrophorus vespilloides]XP_017783077.1 PREDICTED: WD repeat, SAM and U-box domain-containing protein 1 isoform X2 [Nicrophorus vespilloides]
MEVTIEKATILQCLTGHTSDVTSCDFGPNFMLVTGSSDKTVRIWEWSPGAGFVEKSFSPLRGHKYGVTSVKVSPQGSMVATASIDGTAILWNLHSGNKIHTMVQVNGDAIRVCRFAPDSSVLVTAGDNGAICIWDLVHRNLIRTIFQHEGTTQALAFTPDSQYLVSACSLECIYVWHLHDLVDTTDDAPKQPVASVDNAHDMGFLSMDISSLITTTDDPFVKSYQLAASGNSEIIKMWTITSLSVPKHKMISGCVTIEESGSLIGHTSVVTCVKFNSSGRNLVSSSLDKLVKLWDLNGACICTLKGHTRYVNSVAFSRDFTLVVSGSNDKSVIIWDLSGELNLNSEMVKAHHQLGCLLDGGDQENRMVMNAESEENSVTLIEKLDDIFEGAINSCSFHGDSMVATGSSDRLVRMFSVTEDLTLEEVTNSPIDSHSYAVNHVEFNKGGEMLATCSLDGWVNVWDAATADRIQSVPANKLSVRVCRFSPDSNWIITAGDDEIAVVWDVSSMEQICVLEGHSDAITCAAFSPDGNLIVTTCSNADFRLWFMDNQVYIEDGAHDLGILSCDFSENLEPIPNVDLLDSQNYLLVTSGNDSLVKLWSVAVEKIDNNLNHDSIQVKVWRCLQGHGGSVFCVRFSPVSGELVCSTATDRQARIWSVYSADCLHVLEHDSIVTSCAFSKSCTLLVTGCFDKTLWVWKLPQQLIFQSVVANKVKSRAKILPDWNNKDVLRWLKDVGLSEISETITLSALDGEKIMSLQDDEILANLELTEEQSEVFAKELNWLKKDERQFNSSYWSKINEIPEEFICPITQEIMRDPVKISDGFTYERRAITEWFMSGKYTSPMTNGVLSNTDISSNVELRNAIRTFLYDEE